MKNINIKIKNIKHKNNKKASFLKLFLDKNR